jgi:hypothetical protein
MTIKKILEILFLLEFQKILTLRPNFLNGRHESRRSFIVADDGGTEQPLTLILMDELKS